MSRRLPSLSRRFVCLILALVATSAIAIATIPADLLPVTLPMVAIIWCVALGFAFITPRDGSAPIDDIGAWFLLSLTMYTLLPPIVYVALGGHYTVLNDGRLLQANPQPREIGEVVELYLAFVASFTATYCVARSRRTRALHVGVPRPGRAFVIAAVAAFVVVRLFYLFLGLFYDLTGDTYSGTYVALQQLPLVVAQAANVMGRFRIVLNVLLVAVLFSNYGRWRVLVWSWVAFEVVNVFVSRSERTLTFLLLATVATFYHISVRRIRFRTAAFGAIGGLAIFQVLGVLRQATTPVLAAGGFSVLGSAGEFDALFANAYDLLHRVRAAEVHTTLSLHLSEFLNVIPSQLLPFQKQDYSLWYLKSFYPALFDAGGGFAFGIVPQAIIGLGAVELIARGIITGLLCAAAQRYYVRTTNSIWGIVTHVWLLISCYHVFRSSNFALITPLLMGVMPAAAIVWFLEALLRAGFRRQPTVLSSSTV